MRYPAQFVEVDAIRDTGLSWTWNESRVRRSFQVSSEKEIERLYRPRILLAMLRERGYLSEESKGQVTVEVCEGDPTTIEVQAKGTREPLFAVRIFWDDLDAPKPAFSGQANHRSPFGPGA